MKAESARSQESEEEIVLRWLGAEEPRIVHVEDRDYWKERAEKAESVSDRSLSPGEGRETATELACCATCGYALAINDGGLDPERRRDCPICGFHGHSMFIRYLPASQLTEYRDEAARLREALEGLLFMTINGVLCQEEDACQYCRPLWDRARSALEAQGNG